MSDLQTGSRVIAPRGYATITGPQDDWWHAWEITYDDGTETREPNHNLKHVITYDGSHDLRHALSEAVADSLYINCDAGDRSKIAREIYEGLIEAGFAVTRVQPE
jgi:hypothetical protein